MNNHDREVYERNIRLLERKVEILTYQLMKYDLVTPRQIVIEKADITPIVKIELQQLRARLKKIEYIDRYCPVCHGADPKFEKEYQGTLYELGHMENCWIKQEVDKLEV